MNRIRMITMLMGLAAMMVLSSLAKADSLDVTLTNPNPTVVQGTTVVQFFGQIANPSLTDTIYLNTDSTSSATGTLVDDTPFVFSGLYFLNPYTITVPFEIFDLDLAPGLAPGTYDGVFTILGGADGGTFSSFDDLADVNFSVTVSSPVATTPEPGSMVLLLSALAMLLLNARRLKWLNTHAE
jgi:hypothetical protein